MSASGFRAAIAGPWAAIVLFAGCAAERQAPRHGLTAEMIRADGIAVAGVVVVDEVEQIRPPLVEALEQSLQFWRSDMAVTSAGRVREQLGAPAYRRILAGFQQSGALSESDRAELSSSLRNVARFLILARVEKNAVRVVGLGSFRASTKTGTAGSVGVGVSSRNTKVRVLLYDSEVGRTVLSAVYNGSSDYRAPEGRPPLPSRIPRPGDQPDPRYEPETDVPTLVDALLEAFRTFAHDLPGPVEPPPGPRVTPY